MVGFLVKFSSLYIVSVSFKLLISVFGLVFQSSDFSFVSMPFI